MSLLAQLRQGLAAVWRVIPLIGWTALMLLLGVNGIITRNWVPIAIAVCMAALPLFLALRSIRGRVPWKLAGKLAVGFGVLLVLLSALAKTIEAAASRPVHNELALVGWVAAGMSATLVFILFLWIVPEWQVDQALSTKALARAGLEAAAEESAGSKASSAGNGTASPKERAELINEYRRTIAQIVGGFGLVVGLYFTWRQSAITERQLLMTADQVHIAGEQNRIATGQLELARETQVADRFTKAIEQLNSVDAKGVAKLEVRLGAIYALEQIAGQSERFHNSVLDVLTAYIRARRPRRDATAPIDPDIQVALTVIGRRDTKFMSSELPLDLEGADLHRADMRKGHFQGANLTNADLRWVDMSGADFRGANFEYANLDSVTFCNCAEMLGKIGWHERFEPLHADLRGAHFYGAKNVSIFGALTDSTTTDVTH